MKTTSTGDLARILLASFFIILLLVGSMWILVPFLPATIWATTIVVTTWPWLKGLQKKFRNRRGPAVAVMMVGLTFAVLIPLGLGFTTLISLFNEVSEWTREMPELKVPNAPEWLKDVPLFGETLSANWQRAAQTDAKEIIAYVQPYFKSAGGWIAHSLGTFGMFFVHLSLTVVIAGVLYYKGEKAVELLTAFARKLSPGYGEDVVVMAGQSIKAVALGIVVTAFAQSALAGVGLWVANIPLTGILAAAALLLTILQVGPFIPLLIGVAWLYSQDQTTPAILLFVWTCIVGVSDNIMRPALISRGADLPFVLIFSGVIGGIFAFGVVGTFIGPVVLAVAYDLFKSWIGQKTSRTHPSTQQRGSL
jgi:predicted PurR-regulated permease PerM